MKINYFLFFFIFFLILLPEKNHAFQFKIANKYDQIFSKKILSQDDINHYRKIYTLQEECKWKSAKYIKREPILRNNWK